MNLILREHYSDSVLFSFHFLRSSTFSQRQTLLVVLYIQYMQILILPFITYLAVLAFVVSCSNRKLNCCCLLKMLFLWCSYSQQNNRFKSHVQKAITHPLCSLRTSHDFRFYHNFVCFSTCEIVDLLRWQTRPNPTDSYPIGKREKKIFFFVFFIFKAKIEGFYLNNIN